MFLATIVLPVSEVSSVHGREDRFHFDRVIRCAGFGTHAGACHDKDQASGTCIDVRARILKANA
jgi:hypothetical protein